MTIFGQCFILVTSGLKFTYMTLLYHGGDISWPKQFQNGGLLAIYQTLHIEYWIVCCIKTYLIHIYHMSKCSKCNWNRYIEGFCIWNAHFHINRLSPNIAYVILMSWPLMAIYYLYQIIDYCLCSFHIIFNGNK